ncbi:conserved hypothetical protein [Parasynechococcus marenigrum WH 8102]|uniref:HAD-IIIC family phosphatase n=1 Tax=Parasynechococcus marenigrum (strain WH8102) TaxID=84588 RepID=Q7U917_PARMW|nr:conserved hypothetical protein [Parasynechococcus marenigrum WH 8102]
MSNYSIQYLEWALAGHLSFDLRAHFFIDESYFDDFFTYTPDPSNLSDILVITLSLDLLKSSPFLEGSSDPSCIHDYIVSRLNFFSSFAFQHVYFVLPELDSEPVSIFTSSFDWNFVFRPKLYHYSIKCGIVPIVIDDIFINGSKPMTNSFLRTSSIAIDPFYVGSVALRISMEVLNRILPITKLIAVDFDNTLWQGTIAEDGVENIKLPDNYFRFQHFLLEAVRKGIVLIGVTKNYPSVVNNVFDIRTDFPLSTSSFYKIYSGWDSKYSYIFNCLGELNLTNSGIIFLDDSSLEREEMNIYSSEIEAPVLDFSCDIVQQLLFNSCVRLTSSTAEDENRNKFYLENSKRNLLVDRHLTKSEINNKLQLCLHSFVVSDPSDITRAIQLINKTNQFNVSTSRITKEQFDNFSAQGHVFLAYRLSDSVGDYGIIAIVQIQPCPFSIISFVMSCRAMGRKVESAIFFDLQSRFHPDYFKLIYIESPKNKILPDIFAELQFNLDGNMFTADAALFARNECLFSMNLSQDLVP